jgi:hypothetical protein
MISGSINAGGMKLWVCKPPMIRDDNGSDRAIIRPSVKNPQVEIHIHTRQISDGYQVPVGFIIPHIKTTSK